MAKASVLQSAFVLHQWAWSETSTILDLFTREQGRIAAVAKGAKRPYSQLRSVLLPFQRIQVSFSRPKADEGSDIVTLRSAEFVGGAPMLSADRLLSGFYLNELLMKLLARQDAHAHLFDAYADTLQALAWPASAKVAVDASATEVTTDVATDVATDAAALRAFELTLLHEMGVLPELDRNTLTQEPLTNELHYTLRAEAGLVAASPSDPALSAAQCRALQAALMVRHGAALRTATAAALVPLRQQLRPMLDYHLGSPQLRTRQAMLDLRRLLAAPV